MPRPSLKKFTKAMLKEYIFPGIDAAVIFIPDHQEPSPEVRKVLARTRQSRYYPVPGGNRVKMPYWEAKGKEPLFEREAKGWNHEHCSFCANHVGIGELCWTAESKPKTAYWLFCRDCYEKLK